MTLRTHLGRAPLLLIALLACSAPKAGIPTDAGATRDAGAVVDAGHGLDAVPTIDTVHAAQAGRAADAGHVLDAGRADAGARQSRSAGCGKRGKPTGTLHLTQSVGGVTRTFEVQVPSGDDPATPLALTLVFHGAGGTAAGAASLGLQGAPGAASASIFVFPQGIPFRSFGVGWNDTCGGDDMAFFDAMLATVEGDYCVDTSRVFVAGFSWGCDFVTALACCRGDRLRGVAAGSCSDEFGDPADPQSYANLPCPVANRAAIRFTHAVNADSAYPSPEFATTSKLYQSFNTCSSSSAAVTPSPCVAFNQCAQPLVECAYPDLGHALPATWAKDTWSFFSALPPR